MKEVVVESVVCKIGRADEHPSLIAEEWRRRVAY